MKTSFLALLLFAGAQSLPAAYTGRVYVDRNENGIFDKGEKPLARVKVSDGFHVVATDSEGRFSLAGHDRQRFIFITTPSGYMTYNAYYRPITTATENYDFGLLTHGGKRIAKDGAHRFIHISDTEIFNTSNNEDWAGNVRDYAANEQISFVIHTGDICYENGLRNHIQLMNTKNMQVPVYYCIGNHDLVNGKYGEEVFERYYGPVYYSFEVGSVHYVVTPMLSGDYRPGYTADDVCNWLRNDLAQVAPGTPIVFFNHDLLTNDSTFVYQGSKGNSLNLSDYNLKAWIYGHWHINYMKRQGKVKTICTSSLDKGGIDHATSAYRVVDMDRYGDLSSQLRYTYMDRHLCIATPQGTTASSTLTVNTYSSTSTVARVSYDLIHEGRKLADEKALRRKTDWTWIADMPLSESLAGQPLTLRVTTTFRDGRTAQADSRFIYTGKQGQVRLDAPWINLVGNASHSATRPPLFALDSKEEKRDSRALPALDGSMQLAWVTNVGANVFMPSPLIYQDKIYTATIDDDLKGTSAIVALHAADGREAWRCPTDYSVKNSIAITNGLVFAQDVHGRLYAVDASTGRLCWSAQLPVAALPSLVDGLSAADGVVYAGSGKALTAFEAKTGRILWRNKDWSQRDGTTTTLSVGDGVVVGSAQWAALYGNDAKTGRFLWSRSDHGLRFRAASAAIHEGLLYVTSERSFFILDAKTGRTVVRKELPYKLEVTSTPLLTQGEIIFGTADKGLVALDSETLEEKWNTMTGDALIFTSPYTRTFSATVETSPVLAGKTVYVGASDGLVYAIDAASGRKLWKFATGAPVFASVAVSGNTLIATDFGGNVYAFTQGL